MMLVPACLPVHMACLGIISAIAHGLHLGFEVMQMLLGTHAACLWHGKTASCFGLGFAEALVAHESPGTSYTASFTPKESAWTELYSNNAGDEDG